MIKRSLPKPWQEGTSRWHKERAYFLKDLSTFILWLSSEISKIIFKKVIDHMRDSYDQALTWRVWQLLSKQKFRPTQNRLCQRPFEPFPEVDQMHETIFKVECIFHYVIDENTNWGHYVICDITPQAYYVF